MATVATLGYDDTAHCANCDAAWSTDFLLLDIGRQRLRSQGFLFLWFEENTISLNFCPHCELPLFDREQFPPLAFQLPPFEAYA